MAELSKAKNKLMTGDQYRQFLEERKPVNVYLNGENKTPADELRKRIGVAAKGHILRGTLDAQTQVLDFLKNIDTRFKRLNEKSDYSTTERTEL